ncbi:BTAD domain-containing putative transcriptional regulator [Dactylosporangium sp. CA-233914]|uniref:AfsR/SARP family transcriptional regulator n=1 Tax=Dactylosporangium sp. CA-233914 TaxID=3239934 RepID=UPI003D8FA578
MLEFRLLGPFEVWAAGRRVEAGQPHVRLVLAALLVDSGRMVSHDALIDRVWGPTPPKRARDGLYAHIARARRVLIQVAEHGDDPAPIVRRPGGYVLDVDPDRIDVHRYRRLVDRSRAPDHADGERAKLLRDALALWGGEPLAGLKGEWIARMRDGWQQQHLETVIAWAQAELQAGDPAVMIEPLTEMVQQHPLVEPLTAVLMRALHAAGRTASALECYARAHDRLIEAVGVEPGPQLREVHRAILQGAPSGRPARIVPPRGGAPALLPLDLPGFAGRAEQLARLGRLAAAAGAQATAVVIAVVSGAAGVGKTTLAVHWGHRNRAQFPDGQLYVNLRGFDPSAAPMQPHQAVHLLLDALEVPAERIPAQPAAQTALYRSFVAGRRMLLVLDNARDADQVRPLLPGSPGCMVIVTSRNHLTGLAAVEGAVPLVLDAIPAPDARQLLVNRLGSARTAAEPRAVDEIIARCAGLPLALAIAAARASTHPTFRLSALASELQDTRGSLDAFSGEDAASDLRRVFSSSYRTLSDAAARLFRLLGQHPGPDIAAAAAASLAGVPAGEAQSLLSEVARAHLITEHLPGRYTFHDLLRSYAAELVHRVEPERERRAAIGRTLEHYVHAAHAAAMALYPQSDPIALDPPDVAVTPEEHLDADRALAWFAAERAVLVAAVEQASATGFDVHACRLATVAARFLDPRGHSRDVLAIHQIALRAARRLGDRPALADAHRGLARSYTRQGRHDDAHSHLRHALELYTSLGDRVGQAHTRRGLARSLARQGGYWAAIRHTDRAIALYRAADHRAGEADALNALGWYHAQLGHFCRAIAYCERALVLHEAVGDRSGMANTLDSLGYAHVHLRDHEQGTRYLRRALRLHRHTGDRYHEADTLAHLGDAQGAAGDAAAADRSWRESLAIFRELGHPDADSVQRRITADARPAPAGTATGREP